MHLSPSLYLAFTLSMRLSDHKGEENNAITLSKALLGGKFSRNPVQMVDRKNVQRRSLHLVDLSKDSL